MSVKRADKVIITCAITGGIHTPSMSPYLPITPDQIAAEGVAAAQAGAADGPASPTSAGSPRE